MSQATSAPEPLWKRFSRRRAALLSLLVLGAVLAVCLGALPWTHTAMRVAVLSDARLPPLARTEWLLLFGTDDLGRSLLARTLFGGALSLCLGMLAATVAVVIGSLYGAVAGYVGGRVDSVMMRLVDVLYSLPTILLVMLLTVSLSERLRSTGLLNGEWARFVVLALAIGGVSWLTVARVVRGEVLSLRERAYVEAARALGTRPSRILTRHILPNLAGPMIVFATLAAPQAILQESFLSFLGVGVQPPQATWGSLAAEGVRALNPVRFPWWLLVFPCAALSLTLLALNFVGDGLRDALERRSG